MLTIRMNVECKYMHFIHVIGVWKIDAVSLHVQITIVINICIYIYICIT